LIDGQMRLAMADPPPWRAAAPTALHIAAAWVCFDRDLAGAGAAGDPAWVAAVCMRGPQILEQQVIRGRAGASYLPGLVALRTGPLLDQAVQRLAQRPQVVLIDATGRDHPRRAGLALQLGRGPRPAHRRGHPPPTGRLRRLAHRHHRRGRAAAPRRPDRRLLAPIPMRAGGSPRATVV
jgi:hypothetical protein